MKKDMEQIIKQHPCVLCSEPNINTNYSFILCNKCKEKSMRRNLTSKEAILKNAEARRTKKPEY